MKISITIEISCNQLSIINQVITDKMNSFNINTTDELPKVIFSLMTEVGCKLLKKAIDKRNTTGKFKIKLKYHEAFALHQAILIIMNDKNYKHYNDLRTVIGLLNEKLV